MRNTKAYEGVCHASSACGCTVQMIQIKSHCLSLNSLLWWIMHACITLTIGTTFILTVYFWRILWYQRFVIVYDIEIAMHNNAGNKLVQTLRFLHWRSKKNMNSILSMTQTILYLCIDDCTFKRLVFYRRWKFIREANNFRENGWAVCCGRNMR